MSEKKVRVIISGKVQGVFYRAWATETARELGLMGWVRNLSDGTVEAVFFGTPHVVEQMIEKCWQGSPDAVVDNIEISDTDEEPEPIFSTKPTL